MQYGVNSTEISHDKWDIAFVGLNIDERCNAARSFVQLNTKKTIEVVYNATEYTIKIDDEEIDVDLLDKYLIDEGICSLKVLIDCTSTGVAELLVLMQCLYDIENKNFDILYLEPKQYTASNKSFVEKRNFELSLGVEGYIGIPGQSLAFERTDKAVFFCGYESERLDRTFEELDIVGKNSQLIFGIPPFSAGWDMNSYSNHISVIERQNINKRFYYCGAANPLAVCQKLDVFYHALSDEERLFIIPIGTKPMAIGACVYKVSKNNNSKLSILYDHPKKKQGRSADISRWNLYNIML